MTTLERAQRKQAEARALRMEDGLILHLQQELAKVQP